MEERWLGALASVGAIVFFGSYAVPIRLPSAASIDPVVFQAYKSLVCLVFSFVVLPFTRFKLSGWGLAGGSVWVLNGTLAIKAVKLAGIGSTQSIWSGLAIFISYFWGAYVFKEHIESVALSYVSLLIMVLGMAGIAFASTNRIRDLKSITSRGHPAIVCPQDSEVEVLIPVEQLPAGDSRGFFIGVSFAVVAGFVNGSLMVPLKYARKSQNITGTEYLISFGIGAIFATFLLLVVYHIVREYIGQPKLSFHFGSDAFPALLAGLLWNMGNLCSIYGTIYLGMTLGWPLVQCQMLVSATWAVFYFKEVSGVKEMSTLIFCTSLVLTGAVLLFEFGTVA